MSFSGTPTSLRARTLRRNAELSTTSTSTTHRRPRDSVSLDLGKTNQPNPPSGDSFLSDPGAAELRKKTLRKFKEIEKRVSPRTALQQIVPNNDPNTTTTTGLVTPAQVFKKKQSTPKPSVRPRRILVPEAVENNLSLSSFFETSSVIEPDFNETGKGQPGRKLQRRRTKFIPSQDHDGENTTREVQKETQEDPEDSMASMASLDMEETRVGRVLNRRKRTQRTQEDKEEEQVVDHVSETPSMEEDSIGPAEKTAVGQMLRGNWKAKGRAARGNKSRLLESVVASQESPQKEDVTVDISEEMVDNESGAGDRTRRSMRATRTGDLSMIRPRDLSTVQPTVGEQQPADEDDEPSVADNEISTRSVRSSARRNHKSVQNGSVQSFDKTRPLASMRARSATKQKVMNRTDMFADIRPSQESEGEEDQDGIISVSNLDPDDDIFAVNNVVEKENASHSVQLQQQSLSRANLSVRGETSLQALSVNSGNISAGPSRPFSQRLAKQNKSAALMAILPTPNLADASTKSGGALPEIQDDAEDEQVTFTNQNHGDANSDQHSDNITFMPNVESTRLQLFTPGRRDVTASPDLPSLLEWAGASSPAPLVVSRPPEAMLQQQQQRKISGPLHLTQLLEQIAGHTDDVAPVAAVVADDDVVFKTPTGVAPRAKRPREDRIFKSRVVKKDFLRWSADVNTINAETTAELLCISKWFTEKLFKHLSKKVNAEAAENTGRGRKRRGRGQPKLELRHIREVIHDFGLLPESALNNEGGLYLSIMDVLEKEDYEQLVNTPMCNGTVDKTLGEDPWGFKKSKRNIQ